MREPYLLAKRSRAISNDTYFNNRICIRAKYVCNKYVKAKKVIFVVF